MSPQTGEEFIELLLKSKLLNQDQVDLAVKELGLLDMTPAKAAKALIVSRTLTPFQAERLLEGRYRGFFIDRYRVFEILGVGGMGYVYLADDTETKERIVLKVLTERFEADPGMLARFKLEGRAGLKVNHPNVIRSLRLDNTGAVWFLSMEFVKGVSFHELLQMGGPLNWKFACDFFVQAARGLQHVHDQGIIHRDIKPANLIVTKDGNVRLLDFGLCMLTDDKEADEEFSLQMIFGQDRLGTADFIAPEQILNSTQIDKRADIYGLGCTMYFMLTRQLPFPFKKVSEKLRAHRTRTAKPIKEIIPGVPDEVCKIVEKMMSREPQERFESAEAVAAALEPFSEATTINFEFPKILAARVKESKARAKAIEREKKPAASQSSVSGAMFQDSTASSRRMESAVEHMRADSKPAQAYEELIDSFGTPGKSSPSRPKPGQAQSPQAGFPEGTDGVSRLVLEHIDTGELIPLTQDKLLVGRKHSCDITISEPSVSSQHCELTYSDGKWTMTDLGSTNGVAINGVPTRTSPLNPGDKITFGKRMTYRLTTPGGLSSSSPPTTAKLPPDAEPEKGGLPLVPIIAASVAAVALILWWVLSG